MYSKKYQAIFNVTQELARVYNYNYSWDSQSKKSFYKIYSIDSLLNDGKCELRLITNGSNDERLVIEQINLITSILRDLGLDIIVYINNKYKSLANYLDYLEIDYEFYDTKDNNVICEYYNNDCLLGNTSGIESSYETNININAVIDEMDELKDESIDAYLICSTKEEELKACIVINDLRLSGLVCDMCYLDIDKEKQKENRDARHSLIFDNENLQKGLITVIDNVTGEQVNVPEDEIIDYMLGVI